MKWFQLLLKSSIDVFHKRMNQRSELIPQLFEEMKENSIEPTNLTYNLLIQHYIKNKQMKQAENIFQSIKPNLFNYNTLMSGYLKNNKSSSMKLLFEKLKQEKEIQPDEITFLNLITIHCRMKKTDLALKYFEMMKSTYNLKPSIEIFNSLLNGYSILGDYENIMKYYEILNNEVIPNVATFSILIQFFMGKGNVSQAEKVHKSSLTCFRFSEK
jgi:pentatricopeptide repeat protein